MQSSRVRAAIGIGTIALIVVLFIALSGGDDDGSSPATTAATPPTTTATEPQPTTTQPKPSRPRVKTITVSGGKPTGGVERFEYDKGDRVRFRVRSDVADEVHVHGYDISRDVAAGGSVSFSFPADLEGVFEVELEQRAEQIAEVRVSP
jgi:hypothetical protein